MCGRTADYFFLYNKFLGGPQLNNHIKHVKWEQILKGRNAQSQWNIFSHILGKLCDRYIPKLTIKSNSQPPWFDSDVHNVCLKKERLRAKFKISQDPVDYQKFKESRKQLKNMINKKMRSSFNDDEADPAIISKKFWTHVKFTSNSTRIPECVNYKGKFRNNALDQAELFNTFFSDQFSEKSNYDIPVNYIGDNLSLFSKFEISRSSIASFLKKQNPNKAPGPDGIHGYVIKNCASSISYPLFIIFNESFHSGYIPAEWKLANVVPVFKKGDKNKVDNYRPISLTSLIMKAFEKCIRVELFDTCKHLINSSQHGFLPEKSCTTQMVPFVDDLAIGIQECSRTDVIYFDFAKAFDSVNHDIILHKLKHQFNVDGTMLNFLKSYLKNRTQRVVINGKQSNIVNVNSGVPQGSILGPLLFVVFINDMQSRISPFTNIALYADDTKIWKRIIDNSDSETLQNDINALYSWSIKNKINFHPDKCKVLMVTNQTESKYFVLPFDRYPYHMGETYLSYVNSEKDLGVYVGTKLSWHLQCHTLLNKTKSRLGLIRRTCHFTRDIKQKRILYLSLVRSLFEHCSVVWRPSSPSVLKNFETIQRRATKWILSEPFASYEDDEYLCKLRKLDILPLGFKFLCTDLILFHKIVHSKICIPFPSYLSLLIPDPNNYSNRLRNRNQVSPGTVHPIFQCILPPFSQVSIDPLLFKCSIKPRTKVNDNTFFIRTYQEWNKLPLSIRIEESQDLFQANLKSYIWDLMRETLGREKWPG